MKQLKILAAVIFTLIGAGCAPGLGTEIEVSALPPFDAVKFHNTTGNAQYNIKKFSDERKDRSSIEMNDRKVAVTGDLGAIVQAGFSEAVKQSGGTLALFDSNTIEGEIVQWSLKAKPDFPTTKVTSEAEIAVRIVSPEGKVLSRGRYTGSLSAERPYYTEQQLLDAFGQSMNEAILSAVSDSKLFFRVVH